MEGSKEEVTKVVFLVKMAEKLPLTLSLPQAIINNRLLQTGYIQMRLLIMSCLIWIYAVLRSVFQLLTFQLLSINFFPSVCLKKKQQKITDDNLSSEIWHQKSYSISWHFTINIFFCVCDLFFILHKTWVLRNFPQKCVSLSETVLICTHRICIFCEVRRILFYHHFFTYLS